MIEERYFMCAACGQVVQGWHASQQIACCKEKQMEELGANAASVAEDEVWGERGIKSRQTRLPK